MAHGLVIARHESSEAKADAMGRVLLLSAVIRQALTDYIHDKARGVTWADAMDAEYFLFDKAGLETVLAHMEWKGVNLECIRAFARYGRAHYPRNRHPDTPEMYLNRLIDFRKTWVRGEA